MLTINLTDEEITIICNALEDAWEKKTDKIDENPNSSFRNHWRKQALAIELLQCTIEDAIQESENDALFSEEQIDDIIEILDDEEDEEEDEVPLKLYDPSTQERLQPKTGDKYFYYVAGEIKNAYWFNSLIDNRRWGHLNCFNTEAACRLAFNIKKENENV
jgi:hypothetical protein